MLDANGIIAEAEALVGVADTDPDVRGNLARRAGPDARKDLTRLSAVVGRLGD